MPVKFTETAQRALQRAQDEARRMNYCYLGTEQLLLGLVSEIDGIAGRALASLGANLERTRAEVEKLVGRSGLLLQGEMGLTPQLKKVLELSFEEARRLGQKHIASEHLLLGLLKDGEGVAVRVLEHLGVGLELVREQVLHLLGGLGEAGNAPSGAAGIRGRQTVNTPTLNEFGRDLTEACREGRLDPVICRDKEIERVIQILNRRTKNNPCLIGEPGVGKTAIAEGLAQMIVDSRVPETLTDKRVIALDLAAVVAGSKFRGEFEERVKKLTEEARQARNVILFIDEVHTLIGAGAAEGAIDAANILKPALARGELQCIGATTFDEYRKYIERDAALERRFQPVKVGEPSEEEAIQILQGLRACYEAHHRVRISEQAIQAAVALSRRYITDRFLPDKAIDLLDEACSRVRLGSYTKPSQLTAKEAELTSAFREKQGAVLAQEFERAAVLRDKEQRLQEELDHFRQVWLCEREVEHGQVGEEEIAAAVSGWTGIPVEKLAESETDRLLRLEELLHLKVVGQQEGVSALARSMRRARAGLKDVTRPIGSFVFLGPTGVGKTELARVLAEVLFGDESALIRLDMSEYMEKHTVSRLIGAPPGYVGHEDGGWLTEAVRKKPFSVILLDEIEKAHPEVFNILLQVLEDGRLTDSHGRTADFRNTVIIMTSNVGASLLAKEKTMGFTGEKHQAVHDQHRKDKFLEHLKNTFRPEFLNRIDETIVFHPLETGHIRQIIGLMLKNVDQRLQKLGMNLEVAEQAVEILMEKGYDREFGARPLRRTIQRLIEDPLSQLLLKQNFKKGDTIIIEVSNGTITFRQPQS